MADKTISAAAKAIAETPLKGLMDDDGVSVYFRHIWPDSASRERMEETLLEFARTAIRVWRENNSH